MTNKICTLWPNSIQRFCERALKSDFVYLVKTEDCNIRFLSIVFNE